MKTNVRTSSLDAYQSIKFIPLGRQEQKVLGAVSALIIQGTDRAGWVSRRQIALMARMETATVAARVNALVCAGRLIESTETMPCPITGRQVHMVTLPTVEAAA